MRFLLLIFMMVAGCASTKPNPKTLIPKKNGTTCASGNAQVCYNQGARYYNGDGVTQSSAKAIEYMEKACKLGHADGCYWAARKYEEPDDPKLKNPKRARELYQHLCDHNYKQYCYSVANVMINDPLDSTEKARGLRLMQKHCKTDPKACWNLGRRYYFGETIEPDNALAKTYFTKGCKGNYGKACLCLVLGTSPNKSVDSKTNTNLPKRPASSASKSHACIKTCT